MLIYLGTFAASVGIAAYGEHLRTKKNNEKGFYLCLALAVLVMAVLAGLRDPSIGTDSVVYTVNRFNQVLGAHVSGKEQPPDGKKQSRCL